MYEQGRFIVKNTFIGLPGKKTNILTADAHGIREDLKHYGPTLISGPRVRKGAPKVPKGDQDENWRKFSAITMSEVAAIRQLYEDEYKRPLNGFWEPFFGANMVLDGVDTISDVPMGTVLDFQDDGPTLAVTTENTACKTPGLHICEHFGLPKNEAKKFVTFAKGKRGVVGTVLSPGIIRVGSIGTLYLPGTI